MVEFLNPSLEKAGKATVYPAHHERLLIHLPCLDLHPVTTSCQSHFVLECLESFGGRAVEGVLEKVCVLLM